MNIGFKLSKINTEQFAMVDDNFNETNNDIGLQAGIRFGTSSKDQAMICYANFKFEQEERLFLTIEISCEFSIESSTWNLFIKNKNIEVPETFMQHMALITVGTTRGVLHSKTDNTKYNNFVLPTINVTEMINEKGVFEL